MANPNPSPETRFKKGNNANPGGKSKEQKRLETEAARMSVTLRHKMLSAMTERAEQGANVLEMIDPATLKLFKDSEDRAHGTPSQSVDITTGGEQMSFGAINLVPLKSDDSPAE